MTEQEPHIGRALAARRRRLGLSQLTVARRLGVSRWTIVRLERQSTRWPTLARLGVEVVYGQEERKQRQEKQSNG